MPNGASSEQLAAYAVPESPELVELAALTAVAAHGDARGPAEMFQTYSSARTDQWRSAYTASRRSRPAEVYGVSREDTDRMRLVLEEIEHAERDQRYMDGEWLLGIGALWGVIGATGLY